MSKHLYQLLEGLSPSEKKHFDLWSRRYGGEHQYIKIYDEALAILAEKEVSTVDANKFEDSLIRRLKSKGLERDTIIDARAYLYDMLLTSLRIQHEEDSKEFVLKAALQEAKLLERRGMANAAMEKYNAVLKGAKEYQMYGLSIEALKGLVIISAQSDPKNYKQMLRNYLETIDIHAELLKEECHLFSYNYHAFALVRTQQAIIEDSHKAQILNLNNALAITNNLLKTFFSQIFWHSSKASLAILEKNTEGARIHYREIIEIWDDPKNRHLQDEYLRSYIIFLGNYLTYCISTNDDASFQKNIEKLKQVKTKNLDDEAEKFQNLLYVEHLFYLNHGELESAANLAPKIEVGLTKYSSKINKARVRAFRFNMMLVNLGLEQIDVALFHIEHILDKSSHREDVANASKLFHLILLYKLRNHAALDSRVKSLIENLKYNKILHDFESIVLKNLSRLIKNQQSNFGNPKQESSESEFIFKSFYNDLLLLRNKTGFAKPSGFEAIFLWVRSNVEGKSFQELLKNKK